MRLLPALIIVTIAVLLLDCTAEFVSNHETQLGAIMLFVISGLVVFSVKKANKNAKQ